MKGDWVPVPTLLQWIPSIGGAGNVARLYHTATVDSVEYALVSLHVSSRQNPNWVWGTFEHHLNPGRCDFMGCFDSFGAEIPAVLPNKTAFNSQYGTCLKTPALKALMAGAHLSPVWENYCLKSTQVDYTTADGTPYVLGNSVIEGIVGNGRSPHRPASPATPMPRSGLRENPPSPPCFRSIRRESRSRPSWRDRRHSRSCGACYSHRERSPRDIFSNFFTSRSRFSRDSRLIQNIPSS